MRWVFSKTNITFVRQEQARERLADEEGELVVRVSPERKRRWRR